MEVFAYIWHPSGYSPKAMYIPMSHLNDQGIDDIVNFKSLTRDRIVNIEKIVDTKIETHILKIPFEKTSNGYFQYNRTIRPEVYDRILKWTFYCENIQLNAILLRENLFDKCLHYFPTSSQRKQSDAYILHMLSAMSHIQGIYIHVVDYVIVQEIHIKS